MVESTSDGDGGFTIPPGKSARIEACERLVELTPESLDTSDLKKVEHLTVVLSLFYRAKTTYEAILSLCRSGFGQQALMLCRSLFEDMVDAHWVHTNPDTALARYGEHARLMNLRNARRLNDYKDLWPEGIPEELQRAVDSVDDEEERRLQQRYGRFGTRSWTGLGLHQRVEAIAPAWSDDRREQRWLRFFRDFGNQQANETLHPTAASLIAQIAPSSPEHPNRILLHSGPSLAGIDQVLVMAFWTYSALLGLIHDEFEPGGRDEVEQAYLEGMRLFYTPTDEQRRTTRRNDPCPCGSGRKYKRCHLDRQLAALGPCRPSARGSGA